MFHFPVSEIVGSSLEEKQETSPEQQKIAKHWTLTTVEHNIILIAFEIVATV